MAEYKKITKKDIDFPRYCLFFIRNIQDCINKNVMDDEEPLELNVETTYPYCSDAFDLIVKTFERKGINVNIPSFKISYKFNVKYYTYRWRLRIAKELDDLPF